MFVYSGFHFKVRSILYGKNNIIAKKTTGIKL